MNRDRLSRAKRVLRDGERGVSAIILALSMTVMMGAAAIGFDIAKLYYERQMVRNAVDAAAQAGAAQLPTAGSAAAATLRNTVKSLASLNYPDLPSTGVTVSFLCVVANKTGVAGTIAQGAAVDTSQIPATCNPGTYDSSTVKCSAGSCAIPCPDTATCNAVTVSANKQVDFVFAPAININSAMTGAVTTLSCRGSCGGQAPPNPMNVVVMADRTPSMWGSLNSVDSNTGKVTGSGNDSNLNALRSGIEGMLQTMTPDQQYVAFGALHQSTAVANTSGADNLTKPLPSGGKIFNETTSTSTTQTCVLWKSLNHTDANCIQWKTTTTTTTSRQNQFAGTWVPVDFSKNYLTSTGSLNTNTDLYASVHNLAYSNLTTSGSNGSSATYFWNSMLSNDGTSYSNSGTGTHLAAALKGAARFLLSKVDSHNYVSGLDSDGYRAGLDIPVKNVIIFETDGSPDEIFTDASADSDSPLALTNSDDIGSTDDYRACQNFKKVSDEVKAAGILMVTIGFGSVNSATCSNSKNSATARSVLSYAASTQASVTGNGAAESTCSTSTQIAAENSDTDYYYCAATAADLKSVFAAAMGSISGGTKYMAIDGLSD